MSFQPASRAVRAPKRLIQRINSIVKADTVVNVEVNNALHTVLERSTLTRLRMTGNASAGGTGGDQKLAMMVSIFRNGVRVVDAISTAESLDDLEPLELLVRDVYAGHLSSNIGLINGHRIEIDTKIQRKLFPGDQIMLSLISNGSTSDFDFFVSCTMWTKLA